MNGDEILYQYNPKCTVQFITHLLSTTILSVLIMSCLTVYSSCTRQINALKQENDSLKNLIVKRIEENIQRSVKNGYESD
jgi:undecaprenyl pyrophosphate synthase